MQCNDVIEETAPNTASHAELEEKKAAWTEEQLRLAQRAEVPRSEYYCPVVTTPVEGDAAQPDSAFVHRWFALPDLVGTLHRLPSAASSSDTTEETAPLLSLQWEALHRQLQHDTAQQQQQQEHCIQAAADLNMHLPALELIGGVDISFIPNTDDGIACLAILRYPSLECVKTYMHRCTLREPYISSFLAFREIQPVRELFDEVRAELMATHTMPQLLIVDGNGVQHPRRCGLATHLGVSLDIPTIGCSKKMLEVDGLTRTSVEEALAQVAAAAASSSSSPPRAHPRPSSTPSISLPYVAPLLGTSSPTQLYGYAVQGQGNSVKKCIFVSPGHRIGFAVATALVATMLRHRIPEPIRAADLGSRAFIRDSLAAAEAAAVPESDEA